MPTSFERAATQLELLVRQLVKLNTPNAQGVSRRKTLEVALRQERKNGKPEEELAVRFKELEPVALEAGTDYLMEVFDTLSSTRQSNQGGPQAVSFVEIKAYCELTNTVLEPWEVEALRVMDRAFLDEAAKAAEARAKASRKG